MDNFTMQHNYRSKYLVVIDGDVYVFKYDNYKFDPPFLSFKPKHIFIGKSKICDMTDFSGVADNDSDFAGNTLLQEVEVGKYGYISGLEITEFETSDKVIDCISLMGNNLIPFTILLGEKFTYFLYDCYKFTENNKIEEGTLLNATNTSLDQYDYHLEKCGKDSFKKLEHSLIHTCWPGHGEDEDDISDVENAVAEDEVDGDEALIETRYLIGNKEVVKVLNQKCVICLERDSIYASRQCGNQCICQDCFENKGDFDILKCIVCRT